MLIRAMHGRPFGMRRSSIVGRRLVHPLKAHRLDPRRI